MLSLTQKDSTSPLQGPLLCIVGPTAIGKNEAAYKLSQSLDIAIINADSRQVYKDVVIGTGSPSANSFKTLDHYLYNFVSPSINYNLQAFTNDARKVINIVHQNKKLPVLLGGTGQYIWALLENWQIPEVAPNENLRSYYLSKAEKEGPMSIHAELQKIDHVSSSKIHMNNVRRVIRALEVYHATGTPFSNLITKSELGNNVLIIGMHALTNIIHLRIKQRIDAMLEDGWIDEVKYLLSKYPDLTLNFYSSIGYLELVNYLTGNSSFEETVTRIQNKTISFVKKQYNWFSLNDTRIHWTTGFPFSGVDNSWDIVTRFFAKYQQDH